MCLETRHGQLRGPLPAALVNPGGQRLAHCDPNVKHPMEKDKPMISLLSGIKKKKLKQTHRYIQETSRRSGAWLGVGKIGEGD